MKLSVLASALFLVGSSAAVNATTFDNITYETSCGDGMFPFPASTQDVKDNLGFFQNNMGKWQITKIADDHVIMGGGYGYQIKPGSADGIYCVNSDKVITDQATMSKLSDKEFFEGLFKTFEEVEVVTSNGNWVKSINLPQNVEEGREFKLTVHSDFSVFLDHEYVHPFSEGFLGKEFVKSQTIKARFEKDTWVFLPNYVVKSQQELTKIRNDESYFSSLLREHSAVKVKLVDGAWIGDFKLPNDVPRGSQVSVERQSTYNVRVNYDANNYVNQQRSEESIFSKSFYWYASSEKHFNSDTALKSISGSREKMVTAFHKYPNLRLKTSDGNFARSFIVPEAIETNYFSSLGFKRAATFHSVLSFPGVDIIPKKGMPYNFTSLKQYGWHLNANRSVQTLHDVQKYSQAENLKSLLDEVNTVGFHIRDDSHTDNIYLPDNGVNGDIVEIENVSRKNVKVHYRGMVKNLGLGENAMFYFNNDWSIENLN